MATFDFSVKPIEALRNDLDRLTVLRFLLDAPPVANLINLMNELLAEDSLAFDILWAYHDFASAVLSTQPPLVTGDRWRDNLLCAILEKEHSCSMAAWQGRMDMALMRAYARDLGIVQALFLLDDTMIRNWCTPSQNGADLTSWTGFSNIDFYIVEGNGPLPTMRRMLLSSEDWSQLAKPLADLHAQFGAGASLGHRYVEFTGEAMLGIDPINSVTGDPDPTLLAALLQHAQGQSPGCALVTGFDAMLVTRRTLAKSLVPVVLLRDISNYPALCQRLKSTSNRYAVVLPAPHPYDPLLCDLLNEGFTVQPDNIFPILTSITGDPMLSPRFTIVI